MAIFAAWYAVLGLFSVAFPECASGSFDEAEAVCYFGTENYGPLYREVVMLSFLALAPIAVTVAVLCIVLETELRKARRDAP